MKMTTFQLVSLGIFATLILVGVAIFATFNRGGSTGNVGKVVIWGTKDATAMEGVLGAMRQQDQSLADVVYTQKDAQTYISDLINAMASGKGPDLFMISQDQILSFADKISTIPYSTVSQSSFTNSYIDEAQLFLTANGALALPFTINPMVMYFNRDNFSTAGLANPPKYWSDFLQIAPKLTALDSSSNVTRSAVALGGWTNILYAKEILATLFMQAGDPIVARNAQGVPGVVLGTVQNTDPNATENPATSALQFYTEFGNPTKTTYSWNRSLPPSQDAFVSGDLGVYFGLASDYPTLLSRNPNLHFGVAVMPQIQGSSVNVNFGQMTALAIPRTSQNQSGALLAAQKLTSVAGISAVVAAFGLPPVRRDITVDTSKDAVQSVFNQAALISRGWLDPDPVKSDEIFQTMVESVMSSSAQPSAAIYNANQVLQTLFTVNSTTL